MPIYTYTLQFAHVSLVTIINVQKSVMEKVCCKNKQIPRDQISLCVVTNVSLM